MDPARLAEHATQIVDLQYDVQTMTVSDLILLLAVDRNQLQCWVPATCLLDPS